MSAQWLFVTAAYVVALGGTATLTLASVVAMRRAEARAESVLGKRERR